MKSKKKVALWVFVIFSAFLLINPILLREIALIRYYPNPKIAVQNYVGTKKNVELATIMGEEGLVYVNMPQENKAIAAYTFDTRRKKGTLQYKVAKEEDLIVVESYLKKINTAPKSTEQIVFGAGESLAKECSEKTGIDPEFIHFQWKEKSYTIWYIISADGLDELPNLELDGIVFKRPPLWLDYVVVYGFLGVSLLSGGIIFFTFVIPKKRKKDKCQGDECQEDGMR